MSKIFFFTPRFPHPLDKGDKLRAFHQIKALSERHHIMLCALSHEPVTQEQIAALEPYCQRVEVVELSNAGSWLRTALSPLFGMPFQVSFFFSAAARRRVHQQIIEFAPDHLVCQLIRTAEYVKDLPIPKTLDYMDAFSRGLSQRIEFGSPIQRPLLRREQRAVRAYEREVFSHFDNLTIISDSDRQAIDHLERDRIRLLPNGVDIKAFAPQREQATEEILFVGNMSYRPNIMAAQTLAREILPRIKKKRPQCRLLIAGTTPARAVRRLQSESVTVTGWLDDISACYARARVFVAPMVAATGIQNKLLQALAVGVPCVVTRIANQALGANSDELILAESPQDFADAVEQLLTDTEGARHLGQKGRELILRRFQWSQVMDPLFDILGDREAGRPANTAVR